MRFAASIILSLGIALVGATLGTHQRADSPQNFVYFGPVSLPGSCF